MRAFVKSNTAKVFILVCLSLLVAGGVFWRLLGRVDFLDNPALLEGVTNEGVVTLDTDQGKISGRLCGVNWSNNPAFLDKANKLIHLAQSEKVAFEKTQGGCLRIWFVSESGPRSLNEEMSNPRGQ
jgi:hypothetical protein